MTTSRFTAGPQRQPMHRRAAPATSSPPTTDLKSHAPYLASLGLCEGERATEPASSSGAPLLASADESTRNTVGIVLQGLFAELQEVRNQHQRELDEMRRACDEQLASAAEERQALVDALRERRLIAADADAERAREAEQSVTDVQRAASDERRALRTAAAAAKSRAAAAIAERERGRLEIAEAAATHEAHVTQLRNALTVAQRERDALVASRAAVLAEVQAHKKDACEALRREVAALTAALRSAQQAAARADERAARATAAKAKAVDDWRASEAKVAELRARLSRRSNVLHAPSQRPRPLPTAAWH